MDRGGQGNGTIGNTRFTAPLVVNSTSRRKDLFSHAPPDEADGDGKDSALPRPSSSGDASFDSKQTSTNTTRIPRPPPQQQQSSQTRRPFTITDAYKLAEEEELAAAQGSPSPAPRPWRSRGYSNGRTALKTGTQAPTPESQQRRRSTGKPTVFGRNDTASSVDSFGARSRRSDASDSDVDDKSHLRSLGRASSEESVRRGSGLFSKTKLGAKIAGIGKDTVRKSGRNSFDGTSPSQTAKTAAKGGWLSRRGSGGKYEPLGPSPMPELTAHEEPTKPPADEPFHSGTGPPNRPATAPPPIHRSPEKSFAWQADADFTAGDLQVSNSPPVNSGRTNIKIDELKALDAAIDDRFSRAPETQIRNTRIEEIRAHEIEAALKFPPGRPGPSDPSDLLEPPELDEDPDRSAKKKTDSEDRLLRSRPASRTNTRIDELRAREIESLSRRALATARLDEIRERHGEFSSRSSSPDLVRKSSKEPLRSFSPVGDSAHKLDNEGKALGQEVIKRPSSQINNPGASSNDGVFQTEAEGGINRDGSEGTKSSRSDSLTRDDSRDLLRRLAMATNTSPVTEPRTLKDDHDLATRDKEAAGGAFRQKRAEGAKGDARLTVGFAARLRRDSSVDSGSDKRSNFTHSESDPTERIEGEMKLFAPLDNQSEKGSLRAPSPGSENDGEEEPNETPKPVRPDPLTQPTPRVMGAFVETPATVKVQVSESSATEPITGRTDVGAKAQLESDGLNADARGSGLLTRGRNINISQRRPRQTLSARSERMPSGRSSSLSTRRRANSLPRGRSPLVNSARPPTVKDDLMEIQRTNHFEDSTLDDLADLLDAHDEPPKLEPQTDRERELEVLSKMNKRLNDGLLGIRTAKQGIERLEASLPQVDNKVTDSAKDPVHIHLRGNDEGLCAGCHDRPPNPDDLLTYIHLPLPRLWYRQPKFRFTFFGLMLFLLSLWYVAESSVCFLYCKPLYCYPGKPCDWSPDDPLWGYSIPVKLDQWTTGGQGRAFVRRVGPGVADWVADIWDVATGTDITNVDTTYYTWSQRRQHRRRLGKKGLIKPFVERPEDKEKYGAWKAIRLARERAESMREMGYSVGEDESMAGDEQLR
ncbi:hypothetical protein B0H63DRAFT_52411 [Podospora didyma]|uniref:Uncharacterized protein n=1 Tax=Podospora didyma TaxID=330526 RepID=A0AAE0P789_9PEZI|nr:hypothetical protein B0H63DRAFT_52411 [Podospora didyma]